MSITTDEMTLNISALAAAVWISHIGIESKIGGLALVPVVVELASEHAFVAAAKFVVELAVGSTVADSNAVAIFG